MNVLDLDKNCWICGKPERYNVCVDCGVLFYIETGGGDEQAVLRYIEKTNPKRFKQIIADYKSDTHEKAS